MATTRFTDAVNEQIANEFGASQQYVAVAVYYDAETLPGLAALAREEDDLVGAQFVDWFLKEQREEVASMSDLLKVVERASASNILLAEEYLARTAVGDQGVDA